ncbi:uncharacterized protein LOC142339818 [Convolutriloba macropyga]|uniref:uncharacterized protein LOC142339818 n=1 Tax=Convolutriloba macropyga TaxID=536237 RepID=UPI003F51B3CA
MKQFEKLSEENEDEGIEEVVTTPESMSETNNSNTNIITKTKRKQVNKNNDPQNQTTGEQCSSTSSQDCVSSLIGDRVMSNNNDVNMVVNSDQSLTASEYGDGSLGAGSDVIMHHHQSDNLTVMKLVNEEVDCRKRVSCECIKAYMIQNSSKLSQSEIDCFHTAIAEIESLKPRSILNNCELKIITGVANGCNPTFTSGKRSNKFLVVGRKDSPPEFVIHSCGTIKRRGYWGSINYLEWLKVLQLILSAVAFLYVLFYDFDQLHLEMPVEGCLDIKTSIFHGLTPSSPHNSQSYCGKKSSASDQSLLGFLGDPESTSPVSVLSKANDFFKQLGQLNNN